MSSLRKVVCMFRIKFPTKRIFRIFPILRTDGMVPWGPYLWNDPRTTFKILYQFPVVFEDILADDFLFNLKS